MYTIITVHTSTKRIHLGLTPIMTHNSMGLGLLDLMITTAPTSMVRTLMSIITPRTPTTPIFFGHEVRSITQHSIGAPALTPDMLFIWMILLCMLCSWVSDQFGSSYSSRKTRPPSRHHLLDYMSASASLERPATFDEFCVQGGLEPTAEEKPMLRSTFDSIQSSLHGHMQLLD